MTDTMIDRLAGATHDVWVERMRQEGWTYAQDIDSFLKTDPRMVNFDALSEADKESIRGLARTIPEILLRAGYRLVVGEPMRPVGGYVS